MKLEIRRYCPSDRDKVCDLFSIGIKEHINPCFHNAMTSPLYLAVTLVLCAVGYLLGSAFGAVMLPGVWMGLVRFCCYELYASYVRERLRTDMLDIPGNYLSRPDDCFWVAEAEVDGRVEIMGMVAVMTKQSEEGKYAELFRMIISPLCRRMGMGFRMAQVVMEFCRERGIPKVVLETSSTQTSAVALYKKLGFHHTLSHTRTEAPMWVAKVARVSVLRMEKQL